MEFPGDVFPIFQKKLVIMCILRQKKLQLPQRDSPGLEVETFPSGNTGQSQKDPQRDSPGLEVETSFGLLPRASHMPYPQRDSPGLEVETGQGRLGTVDSGQWTAHKGILQAWRLRPARDTM